MRGRARLAVALAVFAAAFAAAPAPAAEDGIAWQDDLAAARELAAETNRPLLLYFTFDT